VQIAEATKLDDAPGALLEQTRLAASREKQRADALEEQVKKLHIEVRPPVDLSGRELGADPRKRPAKKPKQSLNGSSCTKRESFSGNYK
jgi:hypothetical protein